MAKKWKSKKSEHIIQLECIAWFRNEFERKHTGCIIPIVNEATYNNAGHEIKAGASDTIVVLPKAVLFVENKTAIGTQSDDQISFENLISILGYKYYLNRSLTQFKSIVYENL